MRLPSLVCIVAAAAVAPPPAHAADAARLGKVFYEPQRQAIVVPFTGRPPDAKYHRLSGTRHYWEFHGARLPDGLVQHHPIGGDLKRYTVAQKDGGVVRLAFELAIEAKPALRFDARGHRFEIFPFGQELVAAAPVVRVPRELPFPSPTPPPATPAPAPTKAPAARRPLVVAAPTRVPEPAWRTPPVLRVPAARSLPVPSPATSLGRPEPGDGGLLMPFHGPAPDYRVRVFTANPRWLYFEFDHVGLAVDGKRFGVLDDPWIDAWMLTEPALGKVRLYLRLRRTTPVVAQILEPEGRIRFAASAAAAPAGRPLGPAPRLVLPVVGPSPAGMPATIATPAPAIAPAPTDAPAPAVPDPVVPDPADPKPPADPSDPGDPPTEPGEAVPDGAGRVLFPRPDSQD